MEGEKSSKKEGGIDVAIPDTISNVPWRPPGIKHKKNEIFLDVIEKLNMLVRIIEPFVIIQDQCQWKCYKKRNPWVFEDEIFLEWNARIEIGIE
jgi:Adaptor complexes medium subunit family.